MYRFDGVCFNQVSTNPENVLTNECIFALCETHDGSLWIGTRSHGLRRFLNGKIFVYGLKEGFHDVQIYYIIEGRYGSLMIATPIGFFQYLDGKFKTLLANPNYITGATMDSLGRFWIGTQHGIRIIDECNPEKIRSITVADGLLDSSISFTYTDRDGNVWIGSDSGITEWKKGKFITYTKKDGLPYNSATTINQDHDGNIWIGTRNGLIRFANNKWSIYTMLDGLSDNDV